MLASAVAKHPTGLDLKLRRVAAGATQTQLAATLGISRQAITYWESQLRPGTRAVERYMQALREVSR